MMWSNRECVSCFICLVLSIQAYTFLLMSGGTIPDNKFKSSVVVCGVISPGDTVAVEISDYYVWQVSVAERWEFKLVLVACAQNAELLQASQS